MPQEVVNNQMHSQKVDSWSLGVVLYILTHCRKPFTAKSVRELIKQISENEIIVDTSLDENLQILIHPSTPYQRSYCQTKYIIALYQQMDQVSNEISQYIQQI